MSRRSGCSGHSRERWSRPGGRRWLWCSYFTFFCNKEEMKPLAVFIVTRSRAASSGSQRYRCMHCQRKYTSEPKAQGYRGSMRKRALEMYVDGGNLRRIARHLKVAPQTVANWATYRAEALPEAPLPGEVREAEMDEMFTFIGGKKTKSTSSRKLIAKLAVFWVGRLSGFVLKKTFSKLKILYELQ
jgi:hypothetical protein